MTMLFIDARRSEHFDERVRPVFESRGVRIEDEAIRAIQKSFLDGVRVWEVNLDVPIQGSIYEIYAIAHRPIYIHDCMAHFEGRKWSEDENVVLQVCSVFGRKALCQKISSESKATHWTPHRLHCLAFSNDSLTVLAVNIKSLDVFMAVEIWPNELVPLSIGAQRIGEQVEARLSDFEVVDISDNAERLVTKCVVCNGGGAISCDKCEGSGIHLPRRGCEKCHGTGEYKARRSCPKCGGSGNFIGRYGDVMGSCAACNGVGYLEATPCRFCGGNGFLDSQHCRRCDGEGQIVCYHCHGETVQGVRFDRDSDTFAILAEDEQGGQFEVDVPATEIWLQHKTTRKIREIVDGAERLIDHVTEISASRYALTPDESREVRKLQQMIGDIEYCLQQSLKVLQPSAYQGRPVHLTLNNATTQRNRKSAIFDFRVAGNNGPWQKTGENPFGEKTPLRLFKSDGKTPLDLPLQVDAGIGKGASEVVLLSVTGAGEAMTFTIEFPVEVDANKLPENLTVLPNQIPPGEKQQIKHVKRFAQPSNQNHAIIPAMVVPEEFEFERSFEYFDPTIGSNKRQAEAVQMGLSDIGLCLLKGPPGTGKTTVITEIVRQRIKLGQRVLVTSKNHQAVVNVLEKLDKVGGIRMVRHGSSSDPSETERRYLTGGVRTRVHEEVYAKSGRLLVTLIDRVAEIERYQPQVRLALDLAYKLAEFRIEYKSKVLLAEKICKESLEAAEAKYQTILSCATTKVNDAEARYNNEKKSSEVRLRSLLKELKSNLTRTDSLQQTLASRSGSKLPTSPSFFRSVVDWIVPDFMASTVALKYRLEQAQTRVERLEQSINMEGEAINSFASQRDTIVKDAANDKIQAKRIRDEVTAMIRQQCSSDIEKLTAQLREQEDELSVCRHYAGDAAKIIGERCSGDESVDYWMNLNRLLLIDKEKTEKKINFVRRWVRDLEVDSSAVGRCYWDNLQVFFSTCVGIASWTEMVQSAEPFEYVIVDEAATVTTGETIMPLMYAKAGMLVGDEMQLPPHDPFEGKLCCDECKPIPIKRQANREESNCQYRSTCWLSTSFFEYLWRERQTMSRVMLNTQYRMNPRIASFVSEIFYPEGLRSGISEEARTLRFAEFAEPLCLISTSAYKDRFEDSRNNSYFNDLEARMIRQVVVKAEQQLERPAHFGIITPYAEQVRQLQERLKGDMRSFKKVRLADDDIASVNSFQGSERDVIIVSFVRSPRACPSCNGEGVKAKQKCNFANVPGQKGFNPSQIQGECRGRGWLGTGLSFVQDLQRLNVALSRAKSMVILVGDIEALTAPKFTHKYSEGRDVLERFERYVSNTGLVLRVWEVEGGL